MNTEKGFLGFEGEFIPLVIALLLLVMGAVILAAIYGRYEPILADILNFQSS